VYCLINVTTLNALIAVLLSQVRRRFVLGGAAGAVVSSHASSDTPQQKVSHSPVLHVPSYADYGSPVSCSFRYTPTKYPNGKLSTLLLSWSTKLGG